MIRRLGVAMSVATLIMLVIPWTALAIHSDESVTQANATLRVADRTIVATARLAETQEGLNIQVEATGLTPGLHGIHIHAVASCVPADFTSAGGHYNPDGSQHGTENPEGPHAGDLPNIEIGADGTGTLDVTTEMISLSGENTLFDVDGSALVIHAGADDMATDPAGNSGARVACGEIVPGDVELGDDCEYFAVTQHSLCDEFLAFWEANGGLAVFGYPLTDAFDEENPDTGEVYLVQYFERQRFELHPENAGLSMKCCLAAWVRRFLNSRAATGSSSMRPTRAIRTTSPRPVTRSPRSSGSTGRATDWSTAILAPRCGSRCCSSATRSPSR